MGQPRRGAAGVHDEPRAAPPRARRPAVARGPAVGDVEAGCRRRLGIDLAARRRNRLTGWIESVSTDGFVIGVEQAFGNCPQYIQTRTFERKPGEVGTPEQPSITRDDRFDAPTRALIERADTLFIATAYRDGQDVASQGADVSHRGGKPGFVRVDDDRTFTFPDFSGNNHFNTVGTRLRLFSRMLATSPSFSINMWERLGG